MARTLAVRTERWPVAGHFTIARGSRTEAVVVVAEIGDGAHFGRGECVPYPRYGETAEGVGAAIAGLADAVAAGLSRAELQQRLPHGAARNAIDCALWDLEAKAAGRRAWELAALAPPAPLTTAYTISLDRPAAMAEAAAAAKRPLLKIKLGAAGDPERLAAIRRAVPDAELIVDANEGWGEADLAANLAACAAAGVRLVEQPLPAGADAVLATIPRPIPICADESAHDRASLAALAGRYDAINVKLDKTGGLTEALATLAEAERLGFAIMVGCMLSTSLAIAPALLLAGRARYVDLDGPLLLARDRPDGLVYDGATVGVPSAALWG
jgi:L-alanine-DL-glutamate epimerase-like enolase superfamily enzyme